MIHQTRNINTTHERFGRSGQPRNRMPLNLSQFPFFLLIHDSGERWQQHNSSCKHCTQGKQTVDLVDLVLMRLWLLLKSPSIFIKTFPSLEAWGSLKKKVHQMTPWIFPVCTDTVTVLPCIIVIQHSHDNSVMSLCLLQHASTPAPLEYSFPCLHCDECCRGL